MPKKIGTIALILMLILNNMLVTIGAGTVYAETPADSQFKGIVKDVTLVDAYGEKIDGEKYPNRKIHPESTINLTFEWMLAEGELANQYTYYLPDGLSIKNEESGSLISDHEKIGTYQVAIDGKMDITINQPNQNKQQGSFTIQAKLNEEKMTDHEKVSLTFSFGSHDQTIVVPLQEKISEEEEVNKDEEEVNKDKEIFESKDYPITRLNDATKATTIKQNYINKESDGSDKIKYSLSDEMVYEVTLTVSGNETQLVDHVVKIEFLGEHVQDHWQLTKPELASEVKYETEGNKKVAYITFPTLAGGTEVTFPVRLKFKGGSYGSLVPEGYRLNIDAALLNEEGVKVKEANQIHFEAMYSELTFRKEINKNFRDGQNIFAGMTKDGKVIEGETVEVPFNFKINGLYNNSSYRWFSEVTIVDTLPPYAKFDPDRNPGWNLSSDGKTITKTYTGSTNAKLRDAIEDDILWLTFPGAVVDQSYTNTAEASFLQNNKQDYEPNYVLTDEITYILDGEIRGNFFYKYAVTDSKQIYNSKIDKEKLLKWNLRLANPTGTELEDIVIYDYQLDDRMEFVHFEAISASGLKDREIEIVAIVDEKGTEQVIEEVDGKYLFPKQTKGFQVKIDKLAPYTGLQQLYFYTRLKEPENVYYDQEDASQNLFYNYAKLEANGVVPNQSDKKLAIKADDNDRYSLVEIDEKVSISKRLSSGKTQYLEGDDITFYLTFSPTSDVQADRVFKNAKFIDFLPEGITPKEHSTYTIVENYKNTGRTAVIYELGDLKGRSSVSRYLYATVNKLSDEGFNTNEVYFTYEGEQLPITGQNKAPDVYDLYGDGDTAKEINYARADYNYVPAKEVVSRKYIRTNETNNWTTNGITTLEGENFQYRLNVTNYLDNDVNHLMLYEVLPFKGDQAIVQNDAGDRVPRGSDFSNILIGEVEGPSGFTVYYSTDKVLEDETEAVNKMKWQTRVNDYSLVTAIKIEMNDDRVLESKESIDFFLPMQAPKKWALQTGDKAYNSFAISTNLGKAFVEANKVYNEIEIEDRMTKDVEGDLHLDINREQEYKYHIITQIPEDIQDYERFEITDEVDTGLSIINEGVQVTVDGESFKGLTVNVDENRVKVTVEDFKGLEGKQQIELVIPAKINLETNIYAYPDGNIPNSATLDFKHKNEEEGSLKTNPVTVTPKDPTIVKNVNGQEHVTIDRGKEYHYHIITYLPHDISDYTKFIITDDVDSSLSVVENGIKATVDGEEYPGLEISIVDNRVVVAVTDFAGLEGKGRVELVIPAVIKDDVDLSHYPDGKIPNVAQLDFTDSSGEEKQKRTEPVTVTTPEPPVIEKNVEGDDHLEIAKGVKYEYNIVTYIPENIDGYEKVILSDHLDDRLEIISTTVLVNGIRSDFKANVDGQTVTLLLNQDQLNTIVGKKVILQITAQIKSEAATKIIENQATIQLNNHPSVNSNIVTVMPIEPEDPTPTDPTDPSEPEDPTPTDPTDPSEPEDPTPTDPTDPSEPEDPTPTDPTDPSEPEDPTPTDPTDPSEPEDPTPTDPTEPNDDTSSELPNTATNIFNILLIGFGLFVLGILGMSIRRKTTI